MRELWVRLCLYVRMVAECYLAVGACDVCRAALLPGQLFFWIPACPLGGLAACRACCERPVSLARIHLYASDGAFLRRVKARDFLMEHAGAASAAVDAAAVHPLLLLLRAAGADCG